MSTYNFPFVQVVTQALGRLQASVVSKQRLEYLLVQVGWQATIDPADLAAVQALLGWQDSLAQVLALAEDLRYQRGDILAKAEELVTEIQGFYQLVSQFSSAPPTTGLAPFNQAGFWQAFAHDLPPFLLVTELRKTAPLVYSLLFITGVIEEKPIVPTIPGRLPYTQVLLHWNAIGEFLSNPVASLSTRYGWGDNQVLDYQRVLRELVTLAGLFPIRSRLGMVPAAIANRYYTNSELEAQRIRSLILPFVGGILPDASGAIELGLSLTPIPTPTAGRIALSHTAPAGFLIAPYLHGSEEHIIALRSDLQLEFLGAFASDNAIGLELVPGAVRLEGEPGSTAFAAAVNLIGSPIEPIRFFGTNTTSRLDLTGYAVSVGVAGTITAPELLIRAGTALTGGSGRLVLYLEPGDGDNFVAQAFGPDPIKLETSGALTWSSRTGLGIDGAVGLHVRRAANKVIGPLTLLNYALDIDGQTDSQGNKPFTTALTLGVQLKLGPVTATVEKTGVTFELSTLTGANRGLLNDLDVHWGFKGPTGIGISVNSDLVTGGGYLYLDPATHTYSGAANLTLKTASREINLTALGILQTQLPGQPDAYSLVLLITAQFSPIELGLGFTLNGLGGLVGVNRRADTSFLLNMVRRGELDKLLFPANVLDDPAGALALLDGAFPAKEGRYVIGLLGELGWGLPNLITLDVALLLEFPAPLQVIILGVLQALLPTRQNDVLKLRADFIGSVDFGAKKVRFDAFLSDSHILDFSLTGDMAFRLYQGANPLFLLAAGGFHPAFQPPAGAELGTLHRITLALSRGNLELTLAAYFAVTSNTVQFGAHLDLVYGISHGFRVEGHFGFDALFQFHPFQVLLHVAADVAIKAGSHELLSVHLDLAVAGPGPWYIQGEASFRILFFRVGFRINATIGSASPKEKPPLPPNAHAPLVAALQDPASWSVEAPAPAARPGGVVLRPVGATAGQLFIDPRGALVVRQRVAPLGIELQKYGSSNVAPIGGKRFDLLGLVLGEGANQTLHAGPDVEAIRDFFAPDQYRVLTDGQKLSLPSFQSLPGGLRLKRLAGLQTAATATRRVVAYEHKLLDGTSVRLPRVKVDAFRQLAQGSVLGQAARAAQPSARGPRPVGWREDTYAVVFAADLLPYQDAGGQAQDHFGSEMEATQYRQGLLDKQLALPEDVLVVPSYQLALA